MPRIRRHIARACDGMDSERTQRKRDAALNTSGIRRARLATVSLDGTVGGPNLVAPVTQASGVARSTASNVAGGVNELTDGTVARWTLP
jgi:phosphoribosylformimino-5-aminoimidazole carboxamide ribonucleotide (ProFAR) isomerase